MQDIKMVLGVVIGSAVLVGAMIFGLTKMSAGNSAGIVADQNELVSGALNVKENGETKVTVVNFSDIECPACKTADESLKGLRDLQGVKYIYRHFPLPIHKNAKTGANAIEAARQLGKGWEMIDLMFEKQEEWSGDSNPESKYTGYAKSLGLNEQDFQNALKSTETAATVSADMSLGSRLKLNGTPSIFVNGELTATNFVMGKVNELLKK